jgi:carboxyl-terminal processing protease
LQITEEGEPVGWVYKTAVAPDALATTPPAATRPTVVAAATEEPRPVEEPQQALPQERRIALVIGNGRYSGTAPPLANPPNDARLMTAALKTRGFEVIELIDGDRRTMKRAISNFGERLEEAGENSVGLFYYAGHGVQVNGRNYLIPIGAEISREPDVDSEAVTAASILGQMEFARNRLNFVILDSCRNNPYSRGFRGAATGGLARMDASRGTLVAYATGPGEVALDGTEANSPYTLALAKAMAVPGLAVEQMFKRVRQNVIENTNEQQVPWESSSLTGDFFFNPVAKPAVLVNDTVEVRAPSESAEIAFWNSIKDSDKKAAFEDYIRRFPAGLFETLARIRLEEIDSK